MENQQHQGLTPCSLPNHLSKVPKADPGKLWTTSTCFALRAVPYQINQGKGVQVVWEAQTLPTLFCCLKFPLSPRSWRLGRKPVGSEGIWHPWLRHLVLLITRLRAEPGSSSPGSITEHKLQGFGVHPSSSRSCFAMFLSTEHARQSRRLSPLPPPVSISPQPSL